MAFDEGLSLASHAESVVTADVQVAVAPTAGPLGDAALSPVPLGVDGGPSLAEAGGWLAVSTALFGALIGLDLWRRERRRESASGRTAPRFRVDTSSFVPAGAALQIYEPEAPRMRDIGPSRVVADLALPRLGPIATEFRLFRLNDTGIVDLAESGNFLDVSAALRRATAFGEGARVEVWQGRCRVAVLN